MRHALFVALPLVLAAGNTQARADLVSYNMTGTITYTGYDSNLPYANGDHISWTLQYDRSRSVTSYGTAPAGSWTNYDMPGYVITNIVDQTTGYHFPLPSSGWRTGANIQLSNDNPGGYRNYSSGDLFIQQYAGADSQHPGNYYYTSLNLLTVPLPTLNLAQFQFNNLPIVWSSNPSIIDPQGSMNYRYSYTDGNLSFGFIASVDSIPGAFMVPEPTSLTLFLLGAGGLAARGLRRRRQTACLRRPLLTH